MTFSVLLPVVLIPANKAGVGIVLWDERCILVFAEFAWLYEKTALSILIAGMTE
jgi:hypothetical protein